MEHCRAAEHALVAALVMGAADPAELSGRLRPSDFSDPAAGLLYGTILQAPAASGPRGDLPQLLRARDALRSDGYPVSELLGWLPQLPVPAHPDPWATLIVSGSLARQVSQSGSRLVQVSESALSEDPVGGASRVLAFVVAQRAAIHSAERRWEDLPLSWRQTVPAVNAGARESNALSGAPYPGSSGGLGVERELLSGLVAAPMLLDRMRWLRAEDFTDPGCGAVFTAVTDLRQAGAPIDLVTLTASVASGTVAISGSAPASRAMAEGPANLVELCGSLDPAAAFPGSVEFLARRVLSTAVVGHAGQAGEELQRLAAAPATEGGAGAPLFASALRRIQAVVERGERWHESRATARPAAGPAGRSAPRLELLRGPGRAVMDVHLPGRVSGRSAG
ncbi:MAG: helicase DnaB [Frankiales bacterium]|nr:helicase DnaB [Frankiales bacterium]